MRPGFLGENPSVLCCSLCGAEIAPGEPYWYVNGTVICENCLPDFARSELAPCCQIFGEEMKE